MLVSRRKPTDEFFLCPYCGKLIPLSNKIAVRDHVVPKNAWRMFRNTTRFQEAVSGLHRGKPNPEDDSRNLIYACQPCNRHKSDIFSIPNWDRTGEFKQWGMYDLREHAEFFYEWTDVFIEGFVRQRRYTATASWNYSYYTNIIERLYAYKDTYKERLLKNNWKFN